MEGCGGDAVGVVLVQLEIDGLVPWRRKERRAEKSLCESFCFVAIAWVDVLPR